MIITEDYFLDAKKELEKYSNLLSILNLEDFLFCFYVSGFENNKYLINFKIYFEILYSCDEKEYSKSQKEKSK